MYSTIDCSCIFCDYLRTRYTFATLTMALVARLYLNGWPAFAQLPWLRGYVLPDGATTPAASMQSIEAESRYVANCGNEGATLEGFFHEFQTVSICFNDFQMPRISQGSQVHNVVRSTYLSGR